MQKRGDDRAGNQEANGRPVLLDVPEAARMLSLKPSAVQGLIRDGRLDSVEISPRVRRIEVSALHRFVAERNGPPVRQVRGGGR
jgi:hypothetical protein